MAQLTDINILYDQMRKNLLTYWVVKDLQDYPLAFQNSEMPVDESVGKLQEVLNNLSGTVNVVLKDKSMKSVSRGGNVGATIIHTINLDRAFSGGGIGNSGLPASTGIGAAEVQEMIAKERAAWDKEQEIKDLKAEIKELKQGGIFGSVIERLVESPLLGNMLAGSMGAKTAPHITGDNNAPESEVDLTAQDELAERLDNALNKLQAADPDNFIVLLESLAWLATEKPTEYGMYTPMLIKQYQAR